MGWEIAASGSNLRKPDELACRFQAIAMAALGR